MTRDGKTTLTDRIFICFGLIVLMAVVVLFSSTGRDGRSSKVDPIEPRASLVEPDALGAYGSHLGTSDAKDAETWRRRWATEKDPATWPGR